MSVYLQNMANKVINSLKGLIELVTLHSNQCTGVCNYFFVASTYYNINNPTFLFIFFIFGGDRSNSSRASSQTPTVPEHH